METEERVQEVKNQVNKYFDKHIEECCPNVQLDILLNEKEHIVNIGTSVYCTKHKIGYPGGSFVQSVANNDLSGAFGNADHINSLVLRFYVMMLFNM